MAKNKQKAGGRKVQKKEQITLAVPLLIPVILTMGFVPLITYYKSYDTKLADYDWWVMGTKAADVFLYYKMVWFLVVCIGTVFCILYRKLCDNEKLLWNRIFIPLCIYAAITVISTFTSISIYHSVHGIWEQFEPVWMLLGYCLITWYATWVVKSEDTVKTMLRWVLLGVCLVALLGLSQAFYHDFYATDIGKNAITPSTYTKDLTFNFEKGRAYMSLYNPNYVGLYVTLFIPVILTLLLAGKWDKKNLKGQIFNVLLIIALLICLFASQSRAGIAGLAVSLILLGIFFRKYIIEHKTISAVCLAALVLVFAGINFLNGNVLFQRLSTMFGGEQEEYYLKEVITNKEDVEFIFRTGTLHMTYEGDTADSVKITLTDENNETVKLAENADTEGRRSVEDERFRNVYFGTSESYDGVKFWLQDAKAADGWIQWRFISGRITGETDYYFINDGGNPMKLRRVEYNSFFDSHATLANNRGYIWSRTLPLLKKYFFLGSGPDTFLLAFPNDDIVGMFNGNHQYEFVSKPHNMYLQVAVQTGVPSLIAFLVFYIMYFVGSIKLYFKHAMQTWLSKIGAGIVAGTAGYMILGITNDSSVTIAPIFWAFLGIGIGINLYIKRETQ